MTAGIAEASPRWKARLAGALFLLGLLTAASGETLLHGKVALAARLTGVALYFVMTLLVYVIFSPVNSGLALLAASFSFAGLTLEAFRWNPGGVDIALVFHGLYCLLIGYLAFRSFFVPRILGALMAIAGLAWLPFASPLLANHLSPYNLVLGLLGEGSLMLWLLILGVSGPRWTEQAREAIKGRSQRGLKEQQGSQGREPCTSHRYCFCTLAPGFSEYCPAARHWYSAKVLNCIAKLGTYSSSP